MTTGIRSDASGTFGALTFGGMDAISFDATGIKAGSYKAGSIVAADFADGALIENAPVGIGYGTGAGGTVTQATSKSTAVTLNKPTGKITVNGSALGGNTSLEFILNNSLIATNDTLVLSLSGSISLSANYILGSYVYSGGAAISMRNVSASTLSEAFTINFAVIKGATS